MKTIGESEEGGGTTTLAVVAERIGEIDPAGSLGLDLIADARWKLDWMKTQIKELEAQWTDKAIEYAEINDGFTIGSKRYYVADEKQEKDLDVRKTTEALLNVTAGDVDSFCTCLSANAFKPGATKKLLGPELFAQHFSVTFKKKLKADGTPEKQLQCVDERFLK